MGVKAINTIYRIIYLIYRIRQGTEGLTSFNKVISSCRTSS
jgi:hypothetical protein